jgi:hypothetical protein
MDSCRHPSQAAAAGNASSAAQMPPPPPPPPQICTKAVATAPPAGAAAAGAATAYHHHHHQQQYYGHGQFGGAVVPDGFGLPQVKGQRGGVGGGSNFDHGRFGGAVVPGGFRYPHATGQSGGYGPGPGHYDDQQQQQQQQGGPSQQEGGPSQQQGSGVGYQQNQGDRGGGYSRGPGGRHNSHSGGYQYNAQQQHDGGIVPYASRVIRQHDGMGYHGGYFDQQRGGYGGMQDPYMAQQQQQHQQHGSGGGFHVENRRMAAKVAPSLSTLNTLHALGQGSGPNDHEGNVLSRQPVAKRQPEYMATNHHHVQQADQHQPLVQAMAPVPKQQKTKAAARSQKFRDHRKAEAEELVAKKQAKAVKRAPYDADRYQKKKEEANRQKALNLQQQEMHEHIVEERIASGNPAFVTAVASVHFIEEDDSKPAAVTNPPSGHNTSGTTTIATASSAVVASAVSAAHDGQQRTTQLSTITNVSAGAPVNRHMEAERQNQLEQELCQLKARLEHVEQQQTVMGERVVEEVGELHRKYDALDDQVGELKARVTALQKYWNVKANKAKKDAVAAAENTVAAALTLTTDEADKTELKSMLQDGLAVHNLGKADMSIRNAMRKEVLSRTELDPSLCAKSLAELHGALAAQNLEQAKRILNDEAISLYDLLLLDDCLKGGEEQRSRGNFLGGENKEMNFLIAVLVPFARLSFWSTESEDTEQADASFALFHVLLDKLKLDCTARNKGKFFQSQLRYCMLAAAKLGDAQLLVHLASFKIKTEYSYANASVDTVVDGKTTPLKQAQDMESLLAGDRTAMLTGLRAMGLVETGEDLESFDLDRLKQHNKAAITFLKKLGTNRMVTSVQEALDTRGATYSNKSQLTTAAKKAAKKILRDLGNEPGALPKIEIMGVDESDPKAIAAIPGLEKKIRTMLAAAEKNPHALNNHCVKVQLLRNPDAPTQGGYGLCAAKYLKAGSLIMIYAGKVYCRSKDDEGQYDHSAYIFKSDDGQFDIDAEKLGNEASFINGPCESLGEKANVKFLEAYVDGFPYGFIYVMNPIQKNKPILADYGDGYWSVYTSNSTQQDMNDMAGEIEDLERILNKK